MNKQRRKKIEELIEWLTDIRSELNELSLDEQAAYDAMPQSIQNSERGEKMQGNCARLEEAEDSISQLIDTLMEAME
jgi:hypothetical protein